jgi:hypothetical protein
MSQPANGPCGHHARGAPPRPGPGYAWIKSSHSYANGNCVEVARLPGGLIGVRDSRDAAGAVLAFAPAGWQAFLGGLRNRARQGRSPGFSRPGTVRERRDELGPGVDAQLAVDLAQVEFDRLG